jgi:hypothetical protein
MAFLAFSGRLYRRTTVSREKRKTDRTTCFSFQGNRYEAPAHLAGRIVEIRYTPLT